MRNDTNNMFVLENMFPFLSIITSLKIKVAFEVLIRTFTLLKTRFRVVEFFFDKTISIRITAIIVLLVTHKARRLSVSIYSRIPLLHIIFTTFTVKAIKVD